MSDTWEFFPCQMGEKVAFIFYDHGIRESINSFPESQQLRFDLTYKTPADNGMPTDQEFEPVKEIEDRIEKFVSSGGGAYVGRVTTAGHRYFYSYSGTHLEDIETFVEQLNASTGYDIEYRVLDDPEKKGYWEDLYPTDDDWQMIRDSKVVDALKDSGDDHEIPRQIDHWAYFRSESSAAQYVGWLELEGFVVADFEEPSQPGSDWGVHFHRTDSPELYTINSITYKLRHKAKEFGGDYDGWGTSIEKGGA